MQNGNRFFVEVDLKYVGKKGPNLSSRKTKIIFAHPDDHSPGCVGREIEVGINTADERHMDRGRKVIEKIVESLSYFRGVIHRVKVIEHDEEITAATEIYVPALHYPDGVHVEVTDGRYEVDLDAQLVRYWHDTEHPAHTIRLTR